MIFRELSGKSIFRSKRFYDMISQVIELDNLDEIMNLQVLIDIYT